MGKVRPRPCLGCQGRGVGASTVADWVSEWAGVPGGDLERVVQPSAWRERSDWLSRRWFQTDASTPRTVSLGAGVRARSGPADRPDMIVE